MVDIPFNVKIVRVRLFVFTIITKVFVNNVMVKDYVFTNVSNNIAQNATGSVFVNMINDEVAVWNAKEKVCVGMIN